MTFPEVPRDNFYDNRRAAVSGIGFQSEKAVDEAAKKEAGNALFREKDCVIRKTQKVIHRKL